MLCRFTTGLFFLFAGVYLSLAVKGLNEAEENEFLFSQAHLDPFRTFQMVHLCHHFKTYYSLI